MEDPRGWFFVLLIVFALILMAIQLVIWTVIVLAFAILILISITLQIIFSAVVFISIFGMFAVLLGFAIQTTNRSIVYMESKAIVGKGTSYLTVLFTYISGSCSSLLFISYVKTSEFNLLLAFASAVTLLPIFGILFVASYKRKKELLFYYQAEKNLISF